VGERKTMKALGTILQIKNAKAGVYAVKGASGFGFKKASDEPETGSYTVRYRFNGRRPTMGLGSFSEITLAEAREAAKDAVRLARKGVDPIKARDRLKTENLAAERAGKPTVFDQGSRATSRRASGGISTPSRTGLIRSRRMPFQRSPA
jgi:hypothetical protein